MSARIRTVLVTDVGRGSGVTIVRSLGRLGWRVVACDSRRRSLGFRSRYASVSRVYPAPTTDPAGFVDAIEEAVRAESVDFILPVTDEAILPLAAARDRFEHLCEIAMPSPRALDIVTDKEKTLEVARGLGIAVPPTRVVESVEEAIEAAKELSWPLVLKPASSRKLDLTRAAIASATVSFAEDEGDLRQRMAPLEGHHKVLLQSYTAGSGQGVELLAKDGRVLAAFQHRRLAEVPIQGGASALREAVALDEGLFAHSRALVEALDWTGLIMVEFKIGERPSLMEINGRVWGSLPLPVWSGMDFPALLSRLYDPSNPPLPEKPQLDYRVGTRSCNSELYSLWFLQVLLGRRRYPYLPSPRRYQALTRTIGLLSLKQRFDLASLDDPLPALLAGCGIPWKLLSKGLGRLRASR